MSKHFPLMSIASKRAPFGDNARFLMLCLLSNGKVDDALLELEKSLT
jgi:hypothetical protein